MTVTFILSCCPNQLLQHTATQMSSWELLLPHISCKLAQIGPQWILSLTTSYKIIAHLVLARIFNTSCLIWFPWLDFSPLNTLYILLIDYINVSTTTPPQWNMNYTSTGTCGSLSRCITRYLRNIHKYSLMNDQADFKKGGASEIKKYNYSNNSTKGLNSNLDRVKVKIY